MYPFENKQVRLIALHDCTSAASRPFKRTKGGAADIINNNNRLAYISGRAPSTQHGHGMHTVACSFMSVSTWRRNVGNPTRNNM